MSRATAVTIGRVSPTRARKVRIVEELAQYLKNYRYIILVGITGLPTSVIKGSRDLLRQRNSVLKVVKNTLLMIALKQAGKQTEQLKSALRGQNAVIFTNENPFEVLMFLEKQKLKREARAGDIATNEIVIPAGNTGIQPGPLISLFNKLNIPIRIQEGSIWVAKDTVVAKPGDVISPELADLLNKLGMKPIESKLAAKLVIIDNRIISPSDVELDPTVYAERLKTAYIRAFNLAVNAALPVPETLKLVVAKAHREALALSIEAGIPDRSVLPLILTRAHSAAQAIYNIIKSKNPNF